MALFVARLPYTYGPATICERLMLNLQNALANKIIVIEKYNITLYSFFSVVIRVSSTYDFKQKAIEMILSIMY